MSPSHAVAVGECSTGLVRSVPTTRYARSGDVSLAYQVFGDGPVTIVSVPPLAKNIEIAWECAQYRYYFERLGSFSRYVHFDKRGTCLLYTSPSPRDGLLSRMPSSA